MAPTDSKERDIVAYLKKAGKAYGITCRKLRWESHVGAPDWLLLGVNRLAFVECKAPDETPRPKQLHELQRLMRAGAKTAVVATQADADSITAWVAQGAQT